MIYSRPFTVHSLPFPEAAPSPSPAPMINCRSSPTVLSGICATLYVTRNNKLQLARFSSAKLRGPQVTWLPGEIESLSIAAATKHFIPYNIQSKKPARILTDSKPCVQSFEKLCRGELSSSPRVATFLSTISRYQASVRHVAGAAILPSDFASRNAPACDNSTCQVCSFVQCTEDPVVLRTSNYSSNYRIGKLRVYI